MAKGPRKTKGVLRNPADLTSPYGAGSNKKPIPLKPTKRPGGKRPLPSKLPKPPGTGRKPAIIKGTKKPR